MLQTPFSPTHLARPKYRPDIDGLRAVSVLAVVAYHAFPRWVTGGFIGVDVFFVISGYLITTIIFENLDRGTFTFAEFYARRIRRIFPALLVVLAATGILGWFELFADEYKLLGKHVAAGAGFVSNLVLWNEAGYFDPAADTKPLLHLWSLGIEEQFYIVWPLLLWLAWKMKVSLPVATVAVALASFTLNVAGIEGNVVATFYSPLTRIWELLCGSLLAWVTLRNPAAALPPASSQAARDVLSVAGVALLVCGLLLIDKETRFPGFWALVPVLGAVAIVHAGPVALINRTVLSRKTLVWFGLISFPLYLWHWPLLSFARISGGVVPHVEVRGAAVALSIALAWMTYHLVERPMRSGNSGRAKSMTLAVSLLAVGLLGYGTYIGDGWSGRPVNAEKDASPAANALPAAKSCMRTHPNAIPCYESERKYAETIFLVGDSHMQPLARGFITLFDQGILKYNIVAVGRQGCNPFLNTESASRWVPGFGCEEVISSAIRSALGRADVKWVILVARHASRFHGTPFVQQSSDVTLGRMTYRFRGKDVPPEDAFSMGLEQTLAAFSGSGKKVLFVHQVPELDFDPRRCRGRPSGSASPECSIGIALVQGRMAPYKESVKRHLANRPYAMEYDPQSLFCDAGRCSALNAGGELLYQDDNHISPVGALNVAREIAGLLDGRAVSPRIEPYASGQGRLH